MSKAKRNENKICVAICLAVPVKMTKESKMSYKKAAHVLPEELLRKVQEYVDGEFIYILRASDNKKRADICGISCRTENGGAGR